MFAGIPDRGAEDAWWLTSVSLETWQAQKVFFFRDPQLTSRNVSIKLSDLCCMRLPDLPGYPAESWTHTRGTWKTFLLGILLEVGLVSPFIEDAESRKDVPCP